jgi:hypothetical protein
MIRIPAMITPLLHWLSTKHNSIDLAKKAFPYKRIKEHKQERMNKQSEIADMFEAKMNMRFKL